MSAPADTTAPEVDPELLARVRAARAAAESDLDRLPQRLSPSRANDYLQCPRLFYFKSICKIETPSTLATAKGTICHTAFERIFDHPAGQRTPEVAIAYVRPAWEELVNPTLDPAEFPEGSEQRAAALARAAGYRCLLEAGSAEEEEFLSEAETIVRQWFDMERVNNFTPRDLELPNGEVIDGREFHAAANVLGVNLHGFIDRLDRYTTATGEVRWSISDYKTGKTPAEGKKYSPQTMERISEEAFFQLKIYAILLEAMFGIKVTMLRLIYPKNGDREKGIKVRYVDDRMLNATKAQVKALWAAIQRSARTGEWKEKTGPLCPYCFFMSVCPAWAPEVQGIVTEMQRD